MVLLPRAASMAWRRIACARLAWGRRRGRRLAHATQLPQRACAQWAGGRTRASTLCAIGWELRAASSGPQRSARVSHWCPRLGPCGWLWHRSSLLRTHEERQAFVRSGSTKASRPHCNSGWRSQLLPVTVRVRALRATTLALLDALHKVAYALGPC